MSGKSQKKPVDYGLSGTEYVPNDQVRMRVRRLTMLGVAQMKVAKDLGIDVKTLRKHFERELEMGEIESLAAVAGALFNNAVKNNNVIAQIFWLKSRHNWIDRKEVNHNHNLGPALTHEERLALLEAAPSEGPKGLNMMRQVLLDGDAEEVPAEGGEAGDEPGEDRSE